MHLADVLAIFTCAMCKRHHSLRRLSQYNLPKLESNTTYSRHPNTPIRPNFLDPGGTTMFIFPGLGSQYVGMGEDLLKYPRTHELFTAASNKVNVDLHALCVKGPDHSLNKTALSQVAIFVTSLASIERIREQERKAIETCVGAFGFGVGQIAALVFSGSISFQDGLDLVHTFGMCMQNASQEADGGMLTVKFQPRLKVGIVMETALNYCKKELGMKNPECSVAANLFPDCLVFSGNKEALDFIENHREEFGIFHSKRLLVSGGFNSKLMKNSEAYVNWTRIVHEMNFKKPLIPVYCTYSLGAMRDEYSIQKSLKQLFCAKIRWQQLTDKFYCTPPKGPFPRPYICEPSHILWLTLSQISPNAAETTYCLDL